jgi:hypothetical protein
MPSRKDRWSQYDSVSQKPNHLERPSNHSFHKVEYRTGGMSCVGYDADVSAYMTILPPPPSLTRASHRRDDITSNKEDLSTKESHMKNMEGT